MKRVPKYRLHKPTGLAVATFNGRDVYLGKHDSKESKAEYRRLKAEYQACKGSVTFGVQPEQMTVKEIVAAYMLHAERYYSAGSEYVNLKLAVRPLVKLYGDSFAMSFGATAYKAIRESWIAGGASRQYTNTQMKRLLRVVKWGVGEGFMPPAIHQVLKCIDPLRAGRSEAPESPPIESVAIELVDKTLPCLSSILADMVRFQLATGCRPGEVCKITPAMVDRSGEVWEINLAKHKTAWRGKKRVIYAGPKAQAVLAKYLLRGADDYCFSPKESMQEMRATRLANRKTPLRYGNSAGTNVVANPKRLPGDCYTTMSYGKAIAAACKKAGLPEWWPNQLRHTTGTMVRREHGLEAAQVILGHSQANVTEVYAERNASKAIEVCKLIG